MAHRSVAVGPSCNADNATAIVESACIGTNACTIYPNSTTFGDPCFGTVKTLVVQAHCESGSGAAIAVMPGPDPLPVPADTTAAISVNWGAPTRLNVVQPTLQVVSQKYLFDSSPISEVCWANLAALGAQHVRFAPWFPYPKVDVGELDPPSGNLLCGPMMWALGQVNPVVLDCGEGDVIDTIDFASYGRPTGTCGAYQQTPSCHAANSLDVVTALCLGNRSCSLAPSAFNDACPGNPQYLAVQVRCRNPDNLHTYWNFTYVDAFTLDFWNAVNGNETEPIINLSTPPTWLYDASNWMYPDDPTTPWYGYEQGTAPASNLTALGDYYGRMLAWYMRGGFTDEYGAWHGSGHALNITRYEVLNEVDYEHGHTPQSYTAEFDAIVEGIRRWADPQHRIQFVGLSLPNIDDETKVEAWATYFLNASNHAADAVDALNYIGYHAYPTGSGFTSDPTTFGAMFSYVDTFMEKVQAVDAIIKALSPATLTYLDESGTDMDGVLSSAYNPPDNNNRYWVASGAYFAYLYASVAASNSTARTVGQSQLMDAPGQEPSVTILDWVTGAGTAKYWVLNLLIANFGNGDALVPSQSNSSAVACLATHRPDGSGAVLLINKQNSQATVVAESPGGAATSCTAEVVDETTGLGAPFSIDCSVPLGRVVLRPYGVAVVHFT